MTTPTLRSLIAEAEQLLERQSQQRTFAEWQREADALFAGVGADANRATVAYQHLLDIPAPDPATAPPLPQEYRVQTVEEADVEMVTPRDGVGW